MNQGPSGEPKRNRLRRYIIYLSGKQEAHAEQDLKAKIRKLYSNLWSSDVDDNVETPLIELDEDGLVQIGADSHIAPMKTGCRYMNQR